MQIYIYIHTDRQQLGITLENTSNYYTVGVLMRVSISFRRGDLDQQLLLLVLFLMIDEVFEGKKGPRN
jgi:hypothetical protein